MYKLPEIKATYDWFNACHEAEIAGLARINNTAAIDQMEARHDIIERGFFVLMFGQFESAVSSIFENALDSRAANPDWTRRRGWDTWVLRGRKVPFETKLALVMDSKSPSFSRIMQTYAMRNHCAHSGTTNPVGAIDALEADLYQWQRELRT